MNMNLNSPSESCLHSGMESLFHFLQGKAWQYRYTFFSALIIGLLSYLFLFTNKLPNHDDLGNLFAVGTTIPSGRWGLALIAALIPSFSLPWFHGIGTIFLMAVAACFIVHIFDIRSNLIQVLLAGSIVSFPALAATFTYMFTSIYYGIAFLLSVLTVFFIRQKKWFRIPAGAACCVLALSIYQAYIAVTASLMVLLLIQQTLTGTESVRQLFLRGLSFVGVLILSFMVYWGINLAVQAYMGIDMGPYAQHALTTSGSLWQRLFSCYLNFRHIMDGALYGLVAPGFLSHCHYLLLLFVFIEAASVIISRRCWNRIPLLLFLTAVFPVSITCVFLFVRDSAVHSLVLYSFTSFYVLIAVAADGGRRILFSHGAVNRIRSLVYDLSLAAVTAIVVCNCYIGNAVGLSLFFAYENNAALAASLITQVRMCPQYTADTPVAITGKLTRQETMPQFAPVWEITGSKGFHTTSGNYEAFLNEYCGLQVILADPETLETIQQLPAFEAMPVFPDAGCVRMIDDVCVVKLPPIP